ncbi:glycoside hydrolase family 43 protein [Granulicella aggregans]
MSTINAINSDVQTGIEVSKAFSLQHAFMALATIMLAVASGLSQSSHSISNSTPNSEKSFAKPHALTEKWGDQGDGTYVNPILPGDFSDPDVIRVGDAVYMISSTMQYSPGMAVLESRDMVNWKIIGHVVQDLSAIDRALNWDRMNRPGRGIWAGSIRFQSGRFWVYFGTPDQGIYVSTAEKPAGPWSAPHLVLAGTGWDDPCSFRDDDGQNYLVTTHFSAQGAIQTTYNIHLLKLSSDGLEVLHGYDHVIHRSEGSEANKLYKVNELYYHYYSEVKPEGRVPMMERSKSLDGPWESQQLMHVHGALDKEPNQGGLIQMPSDKWYFVSHQGKGDWEGRATVLLPVTWVQGWPIIGEIGPDGIGNMIWHDWKPVDGLPRRDIATSDEFSSPELQPAWEWNYQPNAAMWSLRERPGYLRLYALPPLRVGHSTSIRNVITQRSLRTSSNQFTVKLDLAGMTTGQESGITHFAKSRAAITVVQSGAIRKLSVAVNGVRTAGPTVDGTTLWLRSDWDFAGRSHFSFSTDGLTYRRLGGNYRMTWGDYRGDRIGIFTSNASGGGYLDVDLVRYETAR